MAEYMGVIWLVAVIGFVAIEAATVQFVSIWFAGGALAALIAFLVGASVPMQILIFAVASLILLICTRPFVNKLTRSTRTNTDSLVGKSAIITKEGNELGEGIEARIEGKYWTVKAEDGKSYSEGETVIVEGIEGVKLVVRK